MKLPQFTSFLILKGTTRKEIFASVSTHQAYGWTAFAKPDWSNTGKFYCVLMVR